MYLFLKRHDLTIQELLDNLTNGHAQAPSFHGGVRVTSIIVTEKLFLTLLPETVTQLKAMKLKL